MGLRGRSPTELPNSRPNYECPFGLKEARSTWCAGRDPGLVTGRTLALAGNRRGDIENAALSVHAEVVASPVQLYCEMGRTVAAGVDRADNSPGTSGHVIQELTCAGLRAGAGAVCEKIDDFGSTHGSPACRDDLPSHVVVTPALCRRNDGRRDHHGTVLQANEEMLTNWGAQTEFTSVKPHERVSGLDIPIVPKSSSTAYP